MSYFAVENMRRSLINSEDISPDSILCQIYAGEDVCENNLCVVLYHIAVNGARYVWQVQEASDAECIVSEAVVRAYSRKTIDYAKTQSSSYEEFQVCVNRLMKKILERIAIDTHRKEKRPDEPILSFDADQGGIDLYNSISRDGDEFTHVYSDMFEKMSKYVLKHRGGYIAGWFELLGRAQKTSVEEAYFDEDYAFLRRILFAYKCDGDLADDLLMRLQECRKKLQNRQISKNGALRKADCKQQLTDYASKVAEMLRQNMSKYST